IGQPQREIHQRVSMLEERPTARLRASEAPARSRARKLILTGSHAHHATELASLQKAIQLLDIGAESMFVSNDDLPARLFGGCQNPLDAARFERQWTLAQHIDL